MERLTGKRDTLSHEEGCAMPKFMDVHSGFVGATEEQLRAAHERDLAIEEAEGVHFERAWLDPESGKVFCLSSGPSKEAVLRVHEKAGHPTSEIYELPVEVE
ncbi:SCO4226 family nickel-binding protein [Nonomuraea monospora]|uniref:SCO4226 family nickel-binding protein n=2 Tax=Nonomuraea monospora TaxID=568818 RepID=A0ABN3CB70_9ACTN